MAERHARGFSLVETVFAAAIAVMLAWAFFAVLEQTLAAGRVQAARNAEQRALAQLTDSLVRDEDDAWAIYAPPADVLGKSNADGHEIAFYTRDGKQLPYFWAYDYDASTHIVTRYRFGSPDGAGAVPDVTYAGITRFSAATYPVTALQDAASPIYSPLYAGAALRSGVVRFYPGMPWIAGGNNVTQVRFAGASVARDLQLVTQTAPSGFTVVLDYTPSPAPSALPSVWPAAIAFAASGSTIAAVSRATPPPVAALVNRLLGGALAQAQTGNCHAVAYADAAMTHRLAPGAANPYTGQTAVDANGCYAAAAANAQFWVHEDGYTGTFADGPQTCGSGLVPADWSPTSAVGPTAAQMFSAGPSSVQLCEFTFLNDAHQSATASAAVAMPCWFVGGSCTWTPMGNDATALCNRLERTYTNGWGRTELVSASATVGVISNDGLGNYTFTRTAGGPVTLTASQEWVSYKSAATCVPNVSYKQIGSIAYQYLP